MTAVLGMVVLVEAAGAGPIEDADAAHDRGEYATELRLLRPLAEQGIPRAQCRLGFLYQFVLGSPGERNYAEATKWYRKAAEQGNAEAEHKLGTMYMDGQGVSQDYSEAIKWLRRAADHGFSIASQVLGIMYEEGQRVTQDYVEATKWYRKAAEHGETIAQYFLGRMYFYGKGLPKDYVQAHMWINLAISRLSAKDREIWAEMTAYRDNLAKLMTPGQLAEAQRLAGEWRPAGASRSGRWCH